MQNKNEPECLAFSRISGPSSFNIGLWYIFVFEDIKIVNELYQSQLTFKDE